MEAALPNNQNLVPAPQPDLRFKEDGHIYSVGGITYPSVTQILSGCGIVDFSFLDNLPDETRNGYLERGRRVHRATELYDLDELDVSTVDAADMGYLQAWECFRKEYGFIPHAVEVRRYHPTLGYAGTIDRLGNLGETIFINVRDAPRWHDRVVLDIKTGVSLPWWIDLQLTGYAGLLDEPRRWTRVAVLLRKDGTYLVARQTAPYDEQMRVFQYALAIERLKRDKGGKR